MGRRLRNYKETPVSESDWFRVDNYFIFSPDVKDWQHGRTYKNNLKDPKRKNKNG